MNFKLIVATMVAALSLATFTPAVADEALREQAINTVVMIDNDCSAVHLTGDKYITAFHCVSSQTEGKIVIRSYDGLSITLEQDFYFNVKATDESKDLALLETRLPVSQLVTGIKEAKVAKKLLVKEGDRVYTVGNPALTGRTVTEGLFNDESVVDFGANLRLMYRATPPIWGGNSGGGLFQSDGKGGYELIGITDALRVDQGARIPHLGLYTPLEVIQDFLKKNSQ